MMSCYIRLYWWMLETYGPFSYEEPAQYGFDPAGIRTPRGDIPQNKGKTLPTLIIIIINIK